ncbi:hypothetical protein [Mesorhizobium sp.]|uniref:hypothetical protein n=1 Tax=Mesorhizobium sp. TaxID=1871066 RepID=UPI000FEA03D7|nr:hypothetical protein [Mesorhizobium sp.]RWK61959.1 MAG: hypothetical protein EOR49_14505 [Mesorhizobium sp.]RWM49231.1 MAG: hypothetical protein EOR76_10115 [Mesorhizobium sp.]RWM54081.1 MAG: hypothetical protein EOR78_18255 [Mesorhizobium sp.]RWM57645.1 MAG: hypothetical protein EOR79_15055 [Mesorhizobium sp.]RWN04228.1 MAG: hypothetical protein EOR85_05595 [Mesorhizobium sp.]
MRYELVEEPEGTWAVWDKHTGTFADPEGYPAVGLTKEYAIQLQVLLEGIDVRRKITRGT